MPNKYPIKLQLHVIKLQLHNYHASNLLFFPFQGPQGPQGPVGLPGPKGPNVSSCCLDVYELVPPTHLCWLSLQNIFKY